MICVAVHKLTWTVVSHSRVQQKLQQRSGRIGVLQPEPVVGQEQAVQQVEWAVGQVERAVGQVGQLVVAGDQLVVLVQVCRAYKLQQYD